MNKVLVSALRYSQGPDATAGLATEMVDTIHNEPFAVTATAVLQAMKRADTAGRAAIQTRRRGLHEA